jgi:UDP-2-acetamido-2,6-beta-L-arabino-hexul-4-ose reductase
MKMRVLITGANGFVGQHLTRRLKHMSDVVVETFTRSDDPVTLTQRVREIDWVFHLAGVNRPQDPAEFMTGNYGLTQQLCQAIAAKHAATGAPTRVVYTSSTQSNLDNPYGRSKKAAEDALQALAASMGVPHYVYRLPNVFGPGARPNYNSAVATFCHNIAKGLPITIHDPSAALTLVSVSDVVDSFVAAMAGQTVARDEAGFAQVPTQHRTTVGELAQQIRSISQSQNMGSPSNAAEAAWWAALKSTYFGYVQA